VFLVAVVWFISEWLEAPLLWICRAAGRIQLLRLSSRLFLLPIRVNTFFAEANLSAQQKENGSPFCRASADAMGQPVCQIRTFLNRFFIDLSDFQANPPRVAAESIAIGRH
jgi:hypothetical protein